MDYRSKTAAFAIAFCLGAQSYSESHCAANACSSAAETPDARTLTRVFLSRLTIGAESACAAGLTVEDIETLYQSATDTRESLAPSFQANELAVTAARTELSTLRGRASNLLDPGLEPAIRQWESALAAGLASQTLLWQTAFESSVAALPQGKRNLLAALRENATRDVPIAYKVLTRTADGWTELQKALLHMRTREACHLPANPPQAAVVASASSESEVLAAQQRLDANLTIIRAAWGTIEQP